MASSRKTFYLRRRHLAASAALAAATLASPAFAFKPGTHVAAANETTAQLELQITSGSQPDTLVFLVNGRRLDVTITAKQAYAAVIAWPDFYRAGVVGPDGFPDPLTGQLMMHGNETPELKDLAEQITGAAASAHDAHAPFEDRRTPGEFRSIDFATAMLELFADYDGSAQEKQQILAFVVGYISHGVGDGFAHTWVNDLAGGAWAIQRGDGIWGSGSEEVKHVAIENYIDSLVPQDLLAAPGDGGGHGRVTLSAPVAFLDAFYSRRPAHAGPVLFDPEGDFNDFARHYGNPNQFHGGPFYSYFNAQVELAPALRRWSRMGSFFDLAEDIRDNAFVNFGLDMAELPAQIVQELALNPAQWVDELTFGFADCHAEGGGSNPVEELRQALEFVGGINDRISRHSRHAQVVRQNWIRLSQCSSQNLAKTGAADFDPAQPALNTDACADVVRAGWEDEGNPGGLYRGDVRPGNPVDDEFLVNLKAAFLGGDPAQLFADVDDPARGDAEWHEGFTLEADNGHRSMRANLTRELDYLLDFGFRADDIKDVLMPEKEIVDIEQTYDEFCSAVRDPAFENCLDLAFGPIVAVGRHASCVVDHAACVADTVSDCLAHACELGCPPFLPTSTCADVCRGGHVNQCELDCESYFCLEFPVCEFGLLTGCKEIVCPIISDEDDNCAEAAVSAVECDLESVACNFDAMANTIAGENYAEELLTPARQACDTIDDALAFFECLEGDPTKSEAEQRADREQCIVNRCADLASATMTQQQCQDLYDDLESAYDQAERIKDTLSQAADALRNRPAHELVNLAFLEEDLQDPSYMADVIDAVDTARDNLSQSPPGPGATPQEVALYNRKMAVLDRWDALIDEIEDGSASPTPLADFGDAAEDASNLVLDSVQLGLIPGVLGPTAQRILSDVGPSFRNTFLPFFNTVQGMKIAPMTSQADITGLFAQEGLGVDRLPWNAPGAYSPVCSAESVNPYCDVLKSFDDPNCIDCDEDLLDGDPARFGWIEGRGLVAWNEYDPADPVRYVTTNFPLSGSNEAYQSLYTRVFQIPQAVPGFAGFDDPDAPWTSNQAGLSQNGTELVEGSSSLQVDGCFFMTLNSPRFRTTDWGVVGDRLQFDLYIPASQPNPFWVGGVQAGITIPGANINSLPLQAWTDLTMLPRGGWSTIEFVVPANVQAALLGDFADAQLHINLNTSSCQDPLLLDNLRFGGDLTERDLYHLRGSQLFQVVTSPLFSFDEVSDWASTVPLSASSERVEGTGSVALTFSGFRVVTSRQFSTAEIPAVTPNLSVDVYIPPKPANQSWFGSMQMFVTCGPVSNRPIGTQSLVNRFGGEFNTVEFTLPPDVVSALQGNFTGCRVDLALNISPGGEVRLDNMGFH